MRHLKLLHLLLAMISERIVISLTPLRAVLTRGLSSLLFFLSLPPRSHLIPFPLPLLFSAIVPWLIFNFRLLVGAAVGTRDSDRERVTRLVEVGVDVVVIGNYFIALFLFNYLLLFFLVILFSRHFINFYYFRFIPRRFLLSS